MEAGLLFTMSIMNKKKRLSRVLTTLFSLQGRCRTILYTGRSKGRRRNSTWLEMQISEEPGWVMPFMTAKTSGGNSEGHHMHLYDESRSFRMTRVAAGEAS